MVASLGKDFPPRARALLAAAGFASDALPDRDGSTLGASQTRVEMVPKVADVPRAFWRAKAFMTMAMPFGAQSALIRACQARGNATRGLVVHKRYIAGKKRPCLALISRTDVLLTGFSEAAYLCGAVEEEKAARRLAALGPAVVVIDRGAHSFLVYDRTADRAFFQPAYPVAPVDSTGGADAFGGALMACLIQPGATVKWAAAAAAVAASFAVSTPGADGALATSPLDASRRLALFVRPNRK